jgi:hypothetical protein
VVINVVGIKTVVVTTAAAPSGSGEGTRSTKCIEALGKGCVVMGLEECDCEGMSGTNVILLVVLSVATGRYVVIVVIGGRVTVVVTIG